MADPKVELIRIPLDGGMTTDAADYQIPIEDTTNLIKPPGGGSGFDVRPGIDPVDFLHSDGLRPNFGRIHLCELDPNDGYPPGSFILAFQENITQKILEMSSTRVSNQETQVSGDIDGEYSLFAFSDPMDIEYVNDLHFAIGGSPEIIRQIHMRIFRSGPTTTTGSVRIRTHDGTGDNPAHGGVDYEIINQVVEFAVGELTQDVDIDVPGVHAEQGFNFSVDLSDFEGGTSGINIVVQIRLFVED